MDFSNLIDELSISLRSDLEASIVISKQYCHLGFVSIPWNIITQQKQVFHSANDY